MTEGFYPERDRMSFHPLRLPWETLRENPLPARAGGRQRRQLRRTFDYPKGNEPKPWSKRSKRRALSQKAR